MTSFLHIIPNAYLGGTEKDCLYIIEASSTISHTVLVLGEEGPMTLQWTNAGATVKHLHCLHLPNKQFIANIENNLDKQYNALLYWSTTKLPLVRYAVRKQKCRLAVHAGNPLAFSILTTLKFLYAHFLYFSTIETAIFSCSNYVRESHSNNLYFKRFKHFTSLNPVQLLEVNPYKAKDLSPSDTIILGMTARLDPIKDHETVIKAFADVQKQYPYAELWLMGDGVLRKKLESLCNELNIRDKIKFHGNVPNVYDYLQKLDIFMYATTPAEGLGNVVSEAMANGLPCVVSDLPMMRELAGSSDNVVLVNTREDFFTSILKLIKNSELRKTISQNAFNHAIKNFSKKRYFEDRIKYLYKTFKL
ncbi:MAG: glycosyltransferase [Bacteroidales bacterium]